MFGGATGRTRYRPPYRLRRVDGSQPELNADTARADGYEPLESAGGSWFGELGDGQAVMLAGIVCIALGVIAAGTLAIVRSPDTLASELWAQTDRLAPAPDSVLGPLGPLYLLLLPLFAAGVRVAVVWWPGSATWSRARETLTCLVATAALVAGVIVLAIVPDPTRLPASFVGAQVRGLDPALRVVLAPLDALRRLVAPDSPRQPAQADRMPAIDPEFQPYWVRNHRLTRLWSGPEVGQATPSFGTTSQQFCVFRVMLPQQGGRLYVFNPYTGNYLWLDANDVGPVGEPQIQSSSRPPGQNCSLDLHSS